MIAIIAQVVPGTIYAVYACHLYILDFIRHIATFIGPIRGTVPVIDLGTKSIEIQSHGIHRQSV
ncbi:MAG TPA: hypothetical protein DDW83_07720 [Peptococcaceae bacterium]|nr:hypothetical protein [Peptococcaceae bacterium]